MLLIFKQISFYYIELTLNKMTITLIGVQETQKNRDREIKSKLFSNPLRKFRSNLIKRQLRETRNILE